MDLSKFKKELLRPEHKLVVGDVILEANRFTHRYRAYQIQNINGDWADFKVVFANDGCPKGYTCQGNISCHTRHHRTAWLSYYLPMGRLLYGKK
jgi:hypothetical protein